MNSLVSGSRWEPSGDSAEAWSQGAATVSVANLAPKPPRRRSLVVAAIVVVLTVTGAGAAAMGHAIASSSHGSMRTGVGGDGPPMGSRGQRH